MEAACHWEHFHYLRYHRFLATQSSGREKKLDLYRRSAWGSHIQYQREGAQFKVSCCCISQWFRASIWINPWSWMKTNGRSSYMMWSKGQGNTTVIRRICLWLLSVYTDSSRVPNFSGTEFHCPHDSVDSDSEFRMQSDAHLNCVRGLIKHPALTLSHEQGLNLGTSNLHTPFVTAAFLTWNTTFFLMLNWMIVWRINLTHFNQVMIYLIN